VRKSSLEKWPLPAGVSWVMPCFVYMFLYTVELTADGGAVNSIEQKSSDFYPKYVQEYPPQSTSDQGKPKCQLRAE
jgi:hypothetical protein